MNCTERIYERENGFEAAAVENFGGSTEQNACKGLRLIKKGCGDVALGLKEIEDSQKAVHRAIHEAEEALKALKFAQKEIEKAGKRESEALREVNRGLRLIEDDLRRPYCNC